MLASLWALASAGAAAFGSPPVSPDSLDPAASKGFGYASPWTPLALGAALVVLAGVVNRVTPRKKRRVRRVTILFMLYLTTFVAARILHLGHEEGWSLRVWFLADFFEVLVVIDLVAVLLFDLLLLALRIEVANIAHDLSLGAAYLLALVGMLHRSGVHLSEIITTSAVVTVVLGFSLQTTLGNVIGGIALQLDDSIHVGDWVQLPAGTQGKVKAIRWRHTVLETRNWDTVIVPNASLLNENILILGQRENEPVQHRMWVYFNVDFRFSPDEVIRVVDEALQATPIPHVAEHPRAHTICFDFARDNMDGVAYYAVRYWLTDLACDDPTSSEVRNRIYAGLKRASIPLALPARAVFVSQDDSQHAEQKRARQTAERAAILQHIELFAELSPDELRELAAQMRVAPFGRGEVVTRQGAVAHWLYILAKGQAEVRVRLDSGLEKTVTRLRAPDVFGEMGVMTGEPRSATIVASTEVECFRIDKQAFQDLLKRRPGLASSVSAVMARRRVELTAVKEDLDAEQKQERLPAERNRMLRAVQSFFGLGEDEGRDR